ncbi:MCE family protein [Mycolicibacterium sp.]|uniref:MCE family protein n=1 Tax=Mycolicibacterium sp. TaxID=2320850 RepID=UPI003D0E884A
MDLLPELKRISPAVLALLLISVIAGLIALCGAFFYGAFTSHVPVTLTADRSGLVLERGAKVKMRGVLVGRVATIDSSPNSIQLQLDIDPAQLGYIPANVDAQIRATTAFGAKYVDLIYPAEPSKQTLAPGAVIRSRNVSTEVNTVFQNIVEVMDKIDPSKLNAVLSAFAEALRGRGEQIGRATTAANEFFAAVNPRAETIRRDWQALKGFSDTYGAAAKDILAALNAASTTSTTITENAKELDALLIEVAGMSRSGIELLGPNKDNLERAIEVAEPTTGLLLKYDPQLTCTLVGGKWFLDNGGYDSMGGNGRTSMADVSILLGDDPYRYPENLPIVGAKGGPGGKPGCGSLPIVANKFPHRQLITNTGWGTGLDLRPNSGIGFPGWINYLPKTRAVPEPPSIRYQGPPAPGLIPYPGAPAYGADLYADDGTPLWPGLPPAPPPSEQPPPDPNDPVPGAEPSAPPPAP